MAAVLSDRRPRPASRALRVDLDNDVRSRQRQRARHKRAKRQQAGQLILGKGHIVLHRLEPMEIIRTNCSLFQEQNVLFGRNFY